VKRKGLQLHLKGIYNKKKNLSSEHELRFFYGHDPQKKRVGLSVPIFFAPEGPGQKRISTAIPHAIQWN
jgi:hypothetical protein